MKTQLLAARNKLVPDLIAKAHAARAVHRTLLWSVLAVIACQCGLILVEFAKW